MTTLLLIKIIFAGVGLLTGYLLLEAYLFGLFFAGRSVEKPLQKKGVSENIRFFLWFPVFLIVMMLSILVSGLVLFFPFAFFLKDIIPLENRGTVTFIWITSTIIGILFRFPREIKNFREGHTHTNSVFPFIQRFIEQEWVVKKKCPACEAKKNAPT